MLEQLLSKEVAEVSTPQPQSVEEMRKVSEDKDKQLEDKDKQLEDKDKQVEQLRREIEELKEARLLATKK